MQKRMIFWLVLGGSLLVGPGMAWGAELPGTPPFGFSGKEMFPIAPGIRHLRVADLDGDGRLDLAVANNARSRVTLLYNQTGITNAPPSSELSESRRLNDLPPDARFQLDSVTSEKQIASLEVVDLNGDGRPDIAYYGEPKELVIHYNEGGKTWALPKRIHIRDGQLNMNGLVHGDLNADRRTDLVLLGENHLYLIAQGEDGQLEEPVKIPFADSIKGLQVLDINGDGLDDLLLVNWESTYPVRFRLLDPSGGLGPEIAFPLPSIRSYWADDLNEDGQTEILTIATKSGRAQIANFVRRPALPMTREFRAGQFQTLPFPAAAKGIRGLVWADLNDDRRTDLLISEPDSGELTVYLQDNAGRFASPRRFPSLLEITQIEVEDWDEDGRAEIFLLSPNEGLIGMTHMDERGAIPFPTTLPVEGKPLALVGGRFRAGAEGDPVLAVIVEGPNARFLQVFSASGRIANQELREKFRSNPTSLIIHDTDQDGLRDLVLLVPYEKIKILRQLPVASGETAATETEGEPDRVMEFEEIDVSPPGGNSSSPWMSTADVDGDGKDEMLLAQNNFLRAVVLAPSERGGADAASSPTWSLQVKEQINGSSSDSRIEGATVVYGGKDDRPSLFLYDAKYRQLTLCQRNQAGIWDVTRNLELPLGQYNRLGTVQLGEKAAPILAFEAPNYVSWMNLDGEVWVFQQKDGYETTIKDGWLMDVVAGDLNQDERKDLVFLEGAQNHIEIVQVDPPGELSLALSWKVFEKHSFRQRREGGPEPREARVADFTGDGKNDLALIVHDRILLYPQE